MSDKMPVLKLVSPVIENLDEKAPKINARKKVATQQPKATTVAVLAHAPALAYPQEMHG